MATMEPSQSTSSGNYTMDMDSFASSPQNSNGFEMQKNTGYTPTNDEFQFVQQHSGN